MSTLVAERSDLDTRPGAPFDELDWRFAAPRKSPNPLPSQACSEQGESTSATEDKLRREASWVCEWWPPTP